MLGRLTTTIALGSALVHCRGNGAIGAAPGPSSRSPALVDATDVTAPPDDARQEGEEPDSAASDPPAPVAGWSEQRDGITCRHPDVRADCADGWCRIPAGCFVMGSPTTEWGHPAYSEDQVAVTLTHELAVGQYEVTWQQWTSLGLPVVAGRAFADGGGDCTDDTACPVGNVTWFEAAQFANMMSQHWSPPLSPCYVLEGCTGAMGQAMACASVRLNAPTVYACEGFRLPTRAEGEYTTRAGTRSPFYSGAITPQVGIEVCADEPALEAIAWYCKNSGDVTHRVGLLRPNAWWLYDMTGNAEEWSNDPNTGNPPGPGPLVDPGGGVSPMTSRIRRGGSVIGTPVMLRSASLALVLGMQYPAPALGFRLVRSLPGPADAAPTTSGD